MAAVPPLEPIPAVCMVEDICRLLHLSRAQFFKLRREGTFPIPELPRLDSRPRFSGAAVQAYLQQEAA